MSDIHKGELQDNLGNTVYPHTEADVVFCADGKTAQEKLSNYEDVLGGVTGKSGSLEIGDPNVLATTEATKKLGDRFATCNENTLELKSNGTNPNARIRGRVASNGNPMFESYTVNASGTTDNYLAVTFDGTNFKMQGIKDGGTSVTNALSDLSKYYYKSSASESASVPNGSATLVKTISLEQGCYIIIFNVAFAKNATGYRSIIVNTSPSASPTSATSVPTAGNDIETRLQKVRFSRISSTTDMNFYIMHNAGSELSTTFTIEIIKIA